MLELIKFNHSSVFCIAILLVILFKKMDFGFYMFTFTAVLTTISVFDIGNKSILIFHMAYLIILIKYCFKISQNKYRFSVSKSLFLFVAWCLITIPFSLFHTHTIVSNIDNVFSYVSFNFQQFTQFAYLFIGFSVCLICNSLLISDKISMEKVMKAVDISYVFVLCFALMQLIFPIDFVNTYFRNSVHTAYNFEGTRISGTFAEPSFLALFSTPLFGGYLYRLLTEFKLKYAFFSLLFLAVTLSNQSSSAIMGAGAAALLIILLFPYKNKISLQRMALLFIACAGISLVIIFNLNSISGAIMSLISKLNGEGVSGQERTSSFIYHFNVFVDNFFIGIGYGTVRSFDLFTTWGCEVGIIGLLLYFIPTINLFIKLVKIHTSISIQLAIYIAVYNLILFVSVCEIMFLNIWIYYGVAYYYVRQYSRKQIRHELNNASEISFVSNRQVYIPNLNH